MRLEITVYSGGGGFRKNSISYFCEKCYLTFVVRPFGYEVRKGKYKRKYNLENFEIPLMIRCPFCSTSLRQSTKNKNEVKRINPDDYLEDEV